MLPQPDVEKVPDYDIFSTAFPTPSAKTSSHSQSRDGVPDSEGVSSKILILSNNQIDDKMFKILFPSLKENNSIIILDLSNNGTSNKRLSFSELFFIDNRFMNTLLFYLLFFALNYHILI